MPCIHISSSSPLATASERGASGAVSSSNEDSLVSDVILYTFQDILDKILFFARFKQICSVFIDHKVSNQHPHLREMRLVRFAKQTWTVW